MLTNANGIHHLYRSNSPVFVAAQIAFLFGLSSIKYYQPPSDTVNAFIHSLLHHKKSFYFIFPHSISHSKTNSSSNKSAQRDFPLLAIVFPLFETSAQFPLAGRASFNCPETHLSLPFSLLLILTRQYCRIKSVLGSF